MIVEHIGKRRVLGSSLAGLAIVLSSSVLLGQQPQQQQQSQQPGQQSPAQQQPAQQPGQQEAQQSQRPQQQQQAQRQPGQQPGQAAQPGQPGQPAEQQRDVEIAAAAPDAQQAQPMWNGVRVIQVKHDQVGEFEALMKELRTAVQGSGQPGFTVWKTELGDMNTYHIASQFDSFAASFANMEPPMEPTEWANWLNRIEGTIDSHTVAVARLRPDLSIVPDAPQGQQAPDLLMLITDTVMAGKTREYESFIRDEVVPALRQADINGMIANEVMFGAEGRTWVFAVPLPGWAALDQPSPLVEALGEQGAEELMLRVDALVESTETNVLRYREDLSSQAPGSNE